MIHTVLFKMSLLLGFFLPLTSLAATRDLDSSLSSIDFIEMTVTPSAKVAHFKWDVNSESKGKYFLIEKSTDQRTWKTVTQVESIGFHKERYTYMISEINLAEETHEYFRITRVDKWGNETVLDLVDVNQPVLSSLMLINRAKSEKNQMIVSYSSLVESRGRITVFDAAGIIIFEQKVRLKDGYNRLVVDTRKYTDGNYVVVLLDEHKNRLTKHFVVQEKKSRRTKF